MASNQRFASAAPCLLNGERNGRATGIASNIALKNVKLVGSV